MVIPNTWPLDEPEERRKWFHLNCSRKMSQVQFSFALCLGLYLLPLRFWARPAMWLGANMFLWFNFAAQKVGNYLAQEVRAPKSWLQSQASRAAHPNVSPICPHEFPASVLVHSSQETSVNTAGTCITYLSPLPNLPPSPWTHKLHNTLPISFVLCLPGDLLTLKARYPGQLDAHDDKEKKKTPPNEVFKCSDGCGSENVNPCGTPCGSFSQIKCSWETRNFTVSYFCWNNRRERLDKLLC